MFYRFLTMNKVVYKTCDNDIREGHLSSTSNGVNKKWVTQGRPGRGVPCKKLLLTLCGHFAKCPCSTSYHFGER